MYSLHACWPRLTLIRVYPTRQSTMFHTFLVNYPYCPCSSNTFLVASFSPPQTKHNCSYVFSIRSQILSRHLLIEPASKERPIFHAERTWLIKNSFLYQYPYPMVLKFPRKKGIYQNLFSLPVPYGFEVSGGKKGMYRYLVILPHRNHMDVHDMIKFNIQYCHHVYLELMLYPLQVYKHIGVLGLWGGWVWRSIENPVSYAGKHLVVGLLPIWQITTYHC